MANPNVEVKYTGVINNILGIYMDFVDVYVCALINIEMGYFD